jgi:phosphoglycerol transferase
LLYQGDGLLYLAWVRTTLDEGWYLTNPRLGAPGVMDLRDFPLVDGLHFAAIKLIGLAAPGAGLCYNLYYLLTFPLTTLSALFSLRRLRIAYLPALTVSLLYAFLPYHFFRIGHLFLAAYYLVPLVALLLVRLHAGRAASRREKAGGLLVCLLVGSAGVYYAFFACFFFVVVGLHAALVRRSGRPAAAAGVLAGTVVLGVGINLLPHLAGGLGQGHNHAAVPRSPEMAELFALKPAQLLLPTSLHRLGPLARFKDRYNRSAPLVNENDSSALGLVAAGGFLFLLGRLFWRLRDWERPDLLDTLGLLTAAGLALAVVGGGGTLFSYLVSPKIRGYCRISAYLGFFALAAVAWGLGRWLARRRPAPAVAWAAAALLVLVGVADQTSPAFVPSPAARERYAADAEWFSAVEGSVPPGSMIFQLPYVAYPEGARLHRLEDHDHLRAYLHTRTLRWSYGTMKGRETERWQLHVASLPPGAMARALAEAGFAGVYLNREGYADCAALEQGFREALGSSPLVSPDGRMVFFPLPACRGRPVASR